MDKQCNNGCGDGHCCNYNNIFPRIKFDPENFDEIEDFVRTWELRGGKFFVVYIDGIPEIVAEIPCSCIFSSKEGCNHPSKPSACSTFPRESAHGYFLPRTCDYAHWDNVYHLEDFTRIDFNNFKEELKKIKGASYVYDIKNIENCG